jgi:hypothetical protein
MDTEHPYLRPVDIVDSFKLKRDHEEVIAEVLTLEALRNAIQGIPDSVISFHLDGRNDFAKWIQKAIGCNTLSRAIAEVELNAENPEETRGNLLKILDYTLDLLKETA